LFSLYGNDLQFLPPPNGFGHRCRHKLPSGL
jgi:hypothetical protein